MVDPTDKVRSISDPNFFRPGFLDPTDVSRWPVQEPSAADGVVGELWFGKPATSPEQREWARAPHAYINPFSNDWEPWAGDLAADHFIPRALFPELFKGWDRLTEENKQELYYDPTDIAGLPGWLNSSKKDKMPSQWVDAPSWQGAGPDDRTEIDADWRAEAAKHERWLIDYFQERVDQLLYQQVPWNKPVPVRPAR